ncbi:MAG: 30S ribosomal protein S16 [Syntrophaceae bacterium]|jgi:small subunit ribosomal protein S16|nr:30S ribosomal protein S16 [Syntrophaceae bacterium]
MAVTIRLTRMGTKKKPFYRLVAADSRFPRDGRFIEVLGTYDPNPDPPAIKLNREKVEAWLKQGAIVSTTVKSLLKRGGVSAPPVKSSTPATQEGGPRPESAA